MKTWRFLDLNLIVFQILLLSYICTGFANQATPISGHADGFNPGRECARLLGSAMTGNNEDTASGRAQEFLMLIDLGINHLGVELPKFVHNLHQTVESSKPSNPFLNINTTLSLALSTHAESLLPQLQPQWLSILESIKQKIPRAESERKSKDQDRRTTRTVRGPKPIPVDTPQDFAGSLTSLEYVGQTDEDFIFANYDSTPGKGGFYRVSKKEPRLQLIKRVDILENKSFAVTKWIANGLIYGIGEELISHIFGGTVTQQRLFRLDPRNAEFQWAEKWEEEKGQIFKRVQSTNAIVGVAPEPDGSGKGRIFRFNEQTLRFVPTELVFDINRYTGIRSANELGHPSNVLLSTDPELDLSPLLKTDGLAIRQANTSFGWQDWKLVDGILSTIARVGSSEALVKVHSIQTTYFEGPWSVSKRSGHTDKPPIEYRFPTQQGFTESQLLFQYESLPASKTILYFATYSYLHLAKLMIIDRESWTERPVLLNGGPSIEQPGQWMIRRNRQNEVIMIYKNNEKSGEVAMWSFNQETSSFDLQVHETFESHSDGFLSSHIDYEQKQFVAWTFGLNFLMNLPHEIQQGDGQR